MAVLFFWVGLTHSVLAQETPNVEGDTFGLEEFNESTVLTNTDIRVVIAKIISAVLGLLGIIMLGLVLYAGFTWMTAGGNEEKIAQAKKTLINAVIGLAIIMSAFAIVQFVINALSQATGSGRPGGQGGQRQIETFSGSGSLGKIVLDHYPFRNQTGIARNTKIAVTFAEPMSPASFIQNTNRTCWEKANPNDCTQNDTPKLGDCVTPPAGEALNYRTHCDQLNTEAVSIRQTTTSSTPVPAAALATYDANRRATTFVFRPYDLLGDSLQPVRYTVRLSDKIMKADGRTNAFAGQRSNFYQWDFETGTLADFTGPIVKVDGVIPRDGRTVARNILVQINFSEAMDPTTIQGILGNNTFTNIIFNRSAVRGEWRVSNGYSTVEFISSESCGVNSCGEPMYCLPVVCDAGETGICTDLFETLVRTARLDGTGTFQAVPFTGVTDIAGNALDGDRDGKPDNQPAVVGENLSSIREAEKKEDNYFWKFTVKNEIDRSSPVVERVNPPVDQGGVTGEQPLEITFNKTMMGLSLSGIKVEEYREGENNRIDPLWYRTTFSTGADEKTVVTVNHRIFGPNNLDYYYFPSIPSSVKSNNQNCLYPGRGPDGANACTLRIDSVTGAVVPGSIANCVSVSGDSNQDTGCAQGINPDGTRQPTVAACLQYMKSISRTIEDPS
ncbi:MAG TPA: pilin [Candidatus Kapabacteria bacterium]|nr:pilin [Candidatus Kapabacteria bacterium]